MSKAKYTQITQILAERIRNGVYPDKLPGNRALMAEFGVAKQTMTKALHPLIASGALISRPKSALQINRQYRHSGGIIGLVAPAPTAEIVNHGAFSPVCAEIVQAGFTPVILGFPNGLSGMEAQRIFRADFSGLIFVDSLLSLDIINAAEHFKLPLVSCNRLPIHPQLNYLEVTAFPRNHTLAATLRDRGYQHIAWHFASPLEGYNALSAREWLQVKQDLNLPLHEYDRYFHTIGLGTAAKARAAAEYLEHIVTNGEPVDAIIMNTNNIHEIITNLPAPVQQRLATVFIVQDGWNEPGCALPNLLQIEEPRHFERVAQQYVQAFEMLQELIFAQPRQPLQRIFAIATGSNMDQIPTKNEFIKIVTGRSIK